MSLDQTYTVQLDKKWEKNVRGLPEKLKRALDKKVTYLSENPKHPSLNTKPYAGVSSQKLKQLGVDGIYEFYINMEYRCLMYVLDSSKEMVLCFVGTHNDLKRFVNTL